MRGTLNKGSDVTRLLWMIITKRGTVDTFVTLLQLGNCIRELVKNANGRRETHYLYFLNRRMKRVLYFVIVERMRRELAQWYVWIRWLGRHYITWLDLPNNILAKTIGPLTNQINRLGEHNVLIYIYIYIYIDKIYLITKKYIKFIA